MKVIYTEVYKDEDGRYRFNLIVGSRTLWSGQYARSEAAQCALDWYREHDPEGKRFQWST